MDVGDILRKFEKKISKEISTEEAGSGESFSKEFMQFKRDMMPNLSRYEVMAKRLGSIIKLKISKKDDEKIQKNLDMAHLDIVPSQAIGLSLISFLLVFFVGILISVVIFLFSENFPFLLGFLFIVTSLFVFYYTYTMPARMANSWRLKAGSQMVPSILYIVAYMKHTSNLERAIVFASQHLQPPLAIDFRKIFWDVETGRYSSVKESLDSYLERWREHSVEFIEAFHLIESSLYEPSEDRRIEILERSLQVILDGVYDKMLKYSHDIRSPLTNLYMLGIVLPTLALALLPLASTLLGGMIKWHHVFILFNIIIPFFVFYMTNEILSKRPGGYGESDVLELNPLYPSFKSKKPYLIAFLICLPIFLLGLFPFIFQFSGLPGLVGLQKDYSFEQIGLSFFKDTKLFDFKIVDGNVVGPFGFFALLLSLLIPFSIALFFSIAYRMKTRQLIADRDKSKVLEKEFASSLFQLGNRLGDGMPAEIAFARIAESSRGLVTEDFFRTVNTNIQQLGMSLEQALFNKKRGAVIYYPSSLIATSMKILVESVKKGLQVAARSLMSISEYVKNIQKINERLRDLLAEVISDMKSNMVFLAPLLAGIVVGLASMITIILSKLETMFQLGAGAGGVATLGNLQNILEVFNLTSMIPPYFLQLAVGIYIIEVIFILTSALIIVDAGQDKLKKTYDTGKNLIRGMTLYLITSLIAIISLALLATIALAGLAG